MSLLAVRTQFIKNSGRFDLVVNTAAYADAGADFYITAGQKYLDKLADVPETSAQVYASIAVGEYSTTFQHHCRSVESVFVNSSSERYELEKASLREIKRYYSELTSETTSGAPGYFCLANLRALETTAQVSLGTFVNLTHVETDENYDYRGIIIVPPADEAYVAEISGKFLQNILSADADENYWTTEYPHLLVMAGLRSLEVFNRNTEGVNDWTRAINTEMMSLDMDTVEEESFDVNQMRG